MSISQSHSHMFELTIEIILFITFRRKKTYVQDVLDDVVSDVSKRTVQKYLASLEKLGYIIGDKKYPQGFIPTEKARQLFGAESL
ncbi:hypothetical protein [Acinetobacter variabilis]|uniref:hypothetical protein n=1 Tax=Acinetobacter variabilis TaxID=70346 RepID=UPI0028A1FA48|nr:hypothetical protein [Acinetobacter variabilis]